MRNEIRETEEKLRNEIKETEKKYVDIKMKNETKLNERIVGIEKRLEILLRFMFETLYKYNFNPHIYNLNKASLNLQQSKNFYNISFYLKASNYK